MATLNAPCLSLHGFCIALSRSAVASGFPTLKCYLLLFHFHSPAIILILNNSLCLTSCIGIDVGVDPIVRTSDCELLHTRNCRNRITNTAGDKSGGSSKCFEEFHWFEGSCRAHRSDAHTIAVIGFSYITQLSDLCSRFYPPSEGLEAHSQVPTQQQFLDHWRP